MAKRTKNVNLEVVYRNTPPHPLVSWDVDTKEAVFTWRGLTEEQAAGISAAVLVQMQRTDVTWRSGWTFEQLLRNNNGEAVGFGQATADTAARIAEMLVLGLPFELQVNWMDTAAPYTIEIIERGESTQFAHRVDPGILAGMLIATTTLIWSPQESRVEQYPERMLQVLVADARAEIKAQREKAAA